MMLMNGDGAIDATVTLAQSKPMNTKWFRRQLQDKHLSQRGLAKLLNIDPAAVSLMLRGQRRMTLAEAHRISEILGVATSEVLREAGIPTDDGIKRVPISGICGSEGIVQLLAARTHEKVVAPADVPSDAYAIQCREPGHCKDGWLLFISAAQQDPRERLEAMNLCALTDGRQVLAYIRRGYRRDTYNLTLITDAAKLMQDQQVSWASPVLWIRP
jgi:transcriptional regulator with XRE-family HTH domain